MLSFPGFKDPTIEGQVQGLDKNGQSALTSSRQWMSRWAVVALSGFLVASVGMLAWGFTIDDAFIVFRYAERLASGSGYTFRNGPATDGVTSPLWLGVVASTVAFGLDAETAAKTIGIACAGLAAMLTVNQLRRDEGGAAAWTGTAVFGACTGIGIWGAAGLETGMATLCSAVLLGCRRSPNVPSIVRAGVCVGLMGWIRPELVPCAFVSMVGFRLTDKRWRESPRAWRLAWALAGIGGLGIVLFRAFRFGTPWPLSAAAKPAEFVFGLHYVARSVFVLTGGMGVLLAAYGAYRGRTPERVVASALLVHGVAVVFSGGDWMPGFRLLIPVLPLYAVLIAEGANQLPRRVAAVAVLLTCLAPALDGAAELPAVRQAGRLRHTQLQGLRETLASHSTVALVDIGFLGYHAPWEALDLVGITDPAIGRLPGAYLNKNIDVGQLAGRNPTAIVLHSSTQPILAQVEGRTELRSFSGYPIEQRVAAMPWVRQGFHVDTVVRYQSAYFYLVLVRDAD